MHEKTHIRADASALNFLDKLGINDQLARDGLTEVMINRPHEMFVEGSFGIERIENPELSLDKLMKLANVLCNYNDKHISAASPIHSVTLPASAATS